MNPATLDHSITLGGKEIPYVPCQLPHMDLRFYPENPRIYSVVYTGSEEPSQQDIQDRLEEREHVKDLVQNIKANGGLIDPLLVRDGDFLVLEGNSRLAAYRILSRTDPARWGMVKCHLLPRDIGDKEIFSFLCTYHVVGRQDWAPYEQAGIIWRRHEHHGDSPEYMAREMGLSSREVTRLIEVYSFMAKHGDTAVDHWSYYYEYFKSRKIQTQRDAYPELDRVVARAIKSGQIRRAEDIRGKLTKVAGAGGRVLQSFIDRPGTLDSCYEKAIEGAEKTALYRTLNKFRVKIGDLDTGRSLQEMNHTNRQKCRFELTKIRDSANKWLRLTR